MSLVMNALFQHGVISKERIIIRSALFKATLFGSDKNSWYPILRENSFKQKLPGTISQNSKFIQLMSLMLYEQLLEKPEFLQSREWKMFLLLKQLCEFFLSPRKSEHQINIQTEILYEYLNIRLSLISESVSPITPKHTFTTHYSGVHTFSQKADFRLRMSKGLH